MSFIIFPPKTPIFGYLFDFPIRFYGLILALCFLIGVSVCYFVFKKKYNTLVAEQFLDYSPFVIVFSLIGARLFYVFGSFDYYFSNPIEIVLINHGGLSVYGAIFFGMVAMYYLKIKNKIDFLKHCDVIALCLPLCQATGRFGNYFNQEAFGSPCSSFLKLYVSKYYRPEKYLDYSFFHPTFLYEMVADLIIFIILISVFFKKNDIKKGTITCLYLILYSFARFIIEYYRIDSVLNIYNIPIAQIISVIVFLVSLFYLIHINKKSTN